MPAWVILAQLSLQIVRNDYYQKFAFLVCLRTVNLHKRLPSVDGSRSTQVWPLKEKDTRRALARMESHKSILAFALTLDSFEASLRNLHETEEVKKSLERTQTRQSLVEAREWLNAIDPSARLHEVAKRELGTGQWLLQFDAFERWRDRPPSSMWLHGIPGAGKSVITSTVIESILRSRQGSNVGVAYFYFSFRETEMQQSNSMLKSWIHQLSGPSTQGVLVGLHSSCSNGTRQPSHVHIMEALRSLVRTYRDTYLIVDAHDECSDRDCLLDILETIQRWEIEGLRILFSSRPEPQIQECVDNLVKPFYQIEL